MPNITGSIVSNSGGNSQFLGDQIDSYDGCFQISPQGGKYGIQENSNTSWGYNWLKIDASLSNPIYGNSQVVQPKSIKCFIWLRNS